MLKFYAHHLSLFCSLPLHSVLFYQFRLPLHRVRSFVFVRGEESGSCMHAKTRAGRSEELSKEEYTNTHAVAHVLQDPKVTLYTCSFFSVRCQKIQCAAADRLLEEDSKMELAEFLQLVGWIHFPYFFSSGSITHTTTSAVTCFQCL